MLPLNYTAGSSGKNQTEDSGPNGRNLRSTVDLAGSIRLILSTIKPIAIPVDLKPRHRGPDRRTTADGVAFWLQRLTGSVASLQSIATGARASRQLRRTAEMGRWHRGAKYEMLLKSPGSRQLVLNCL
jgi:hypothetical protein